MAVRVPLARLLLTHSSLQIEPQIGSLTLYSPHFGLAMQSVVDSSDTHLHKHTAEEEGKWVGFWLILNLAHFGLRPNVFTFYPHSFANGMDGDTSNFIQGWQEAKKNLVLQL